jgi:hypothetical protein
MTRSSPLKYNFIDDDNKFDKNNGFCVVDEFCGSYNLSRHQFVEMSHEIAKRIEQKRVEDRHKQSEHLDYDIPNDDDVDRFGFRVVCPVKNL